MEPTIVCSGVRAFRSSAIALGPNDKAKKKVKKPLPREVLTRILKQKRETLAQRTAELQAKFEAVKDQPVIHWKPPTLQAWITNIKKEPVGIVPLNADVWGQDIRVDIVQRVVKWQRASWMQGTHKAKSRSEMRGGGRKPRPQKGSGRARLGSIRSPLMIRGGNAHPPRPRDHSYHLPDQVVRKGICVSLSAKFKEGNMFVIKDTILDTHKTKDLLSILSDHWSNIAHNDIAIVTTEEELDPNFALAARNVKSVDFYTPSNVNVYDIVKRHHLIITETALKALEERLLRRRRSIKFVMDTPIPKLSEVGRLQVSKVKRKQYIAGRVAMEKKVRNTLPFFSHLRHYEFLYKRIYFSRVTYEPTRKCESYLDCGS